MIEKACLINYEQSSVRFYVCQYESEAFVLDVPLVVNYERPTLLQITPSGKGRSTRSSSQREKEAVISQLYIKSS